MKIIKLKDMSYKWVSFDTEKNKFKVYAIYKKKLVHIAYLETEKEAKMLSGLISMVVEFHDLTNVECLKTYCLTRYNNILAIQEENELEEENKQKRYKKRRKYISTRDIYGFNENTYEQGDDEFDYSERFKKGWDEL